MAEPGLASTSRNLALDVVKGELVLLMVFYHWTNYFVGADAVYYPHIRFVTTSFIVITGFLVTDVYTSKYSMSWHRGARRLITRGLKLLVLFTALNVGANLVASHNYNGMPLGLEVFITNAPIIYTVGAGQFAAFEILVPIAYLLIVAPIVLATQYHVYAIGAFCLLTLIVDVTLEAHGVVSYNLQLFAAGALGMALGCLGIETVEKLARRLTLVLVAYTVYLAAISVWGVPYAMQLVAACVNVLLLYALAIRMQEGSTTQRCLLLLGRYSVAAYIAQIGILQVLRRVLPSSLPTAEIWLASLIAVFVLTTSVILLLHGLKTRSTLVARLYSTILA